MEILREGHKYNLDNLKSDGVQTLNFHQDPKLNNGKHLDGTNNQEVLRALIDRVKFLNNQLPDDRNQEIIKHLRKALILHEQRHLDRLVDKDYPVEDLPTSDTGHFI